MALMFEEGDTCPESDCDGKLEFPDVEGCRCHMGNPPCSPCVKNKLTCNECDWEDDI